MSDPEPVTVRAVEPEDYAAVQRIYGAPRAQAWTLQLPYPSRHLWQERLARPQPDFRAFVACVGVEPVGHIGLAIATNPRRRHSASVGMAVRDDHAGAGLGDSMMRAVLDLADNWLALRRIELTVFADNDRAIRLYERTGFEVEGRLRDYAFRDGAYRDVLSMARLRVA